MQTVTYDDLVAAFRKLDIVSGDIVIVHSSLKSFGQVIGGADSVIDALQICVGKAGTLVFPTLVQRNFERAYETWDKEKSPSDVGLISETFRLRPGVLRSDQATHSVAALGPAAAELVADHGAYGLRDGPFGHTPFAWASPWQKLYFCRAKLLFLGVTMLYNTFKHLIEHRLTEYWVERIFDPEHRAAALAELARFNHPGVWPWIGAEQIERMLEERDLLSRTICGDARLTLCRADVCFDLTFAAVLAHPEDWLKEPALDWWQRYRA
ncbi:MAG: AAC(3) family N-acetyltransferase [Clostridiaceae bacterium]|nr:AAC(3) family N-acetyltransferase [Clostridiaceae bacterium]